MSGKEKKIKLRHILKDYTYTAYLYYDSELEVDEKFSNPIKNAIKNENLEGFTYINASKGLVENWRYFEKDYKTDSVFELKYGDIVIGNASVCFENDKSGTCDNMLIKNIRIKFKNCNCKMI